MSGVTQRTTRRTTRRTTAVKAITSNRDYQIQVDKTKPKSQQVQITVKIRQEIIELNVLSSRQITATPWYTTWYTFTKGSRDEIKERNRYWRVLNTKKGHPHEICKCPAIKGDLMWLSHQTQSGIYHWARSNPAQGWEMTFYQWMWFTMCIVTQEAISHPQ